MIRGRTNKLKKNCGQRFLIDVPNKSKNITLSKYHLYPLLSPRCPKDILKVSPRYAQDIQNDVPKMSKEVQNISPGFSQNIHRMSPRCSQFVPKFFKPFTKYVHKMPPTVSKVVQALIQIYPQYVPNLLPKYPQMNPNMFPRSSIYPQNFSRCYKEVFKMSQNISKICHDVLNIYSRCSHVHKTSRQ